MVEIGGGGSKIIKFNPSFLILLWAWKVITLGRQEMHTKH
jgi:hypothetical protein